MPSSTRKVVAGTAGLLKKSVHRQGPDRRLAPPNANMTIVATELAPNGRPVSQDRGAPIHFVLGKGQVPYVLEKVAASMCRDEQCTVFEEDVPRYDVELVSWTVTDDVSAARDGSILKERIEVGDEFDYYTPDYESTVTMDIEGRESAAGEPFLKKSGLTFTIGDGTVPASLEVAICRMRRKEVSRVTVSAAAAKSVGDVVYDVTLHSYSRVDPWTSPSTMEEALKRKEEGNVLFKAGENLRALRKYKRGLEFAAAGDRTGDDTPRKTLTAQLYNNITLLSFQVEDWAEVLAASEMSIKLNPNAAANWKAYLRRGVAFSKIGEFAEAKKALKLILEKDADNEDARRELSSVENLERDHEKKERVVYSKMFTK
eukprot:PhM_4_TR7645/c0_g1_i1/m.45093/K09571/FKBP4_5; FK506-binding protein 4/5